MRTLLAVVLLSLAAFAHAGGTPPVEYCVGTSAELSNAFQLAQVHALSGLDTRLKLRKTGQDYHVSLESSTDYRGLEIVGGYTDAGCATRDFDDQTTLKLDAGTHLRILGKFLLSNLRLVPIKPLHVEAKGPGTTTVDFVTSTLALETPKSHILHVSRNGGADGTTIVLKIAGSVFTTSLPLANDIYPACAVRVYNGNDSLDGPMTVDFVNNTVARTGGRGVCLYRAKIFSAANNIIQDTPAGSIVDQDSTEPTQANLSHNFLEHGTLLYEKSELETRATDPGFVDAANFDFRLDTSVVSGAINTGLDVDAFLPAFDLDGNPRRQGSAFDHGAYESDIDDVSSTLVVTSNADSGPGTLRNAIQAANVVPGQQLIRFDYGVGPDTCGKTRTIALASPLPDITDSLIIDGYNAPNAAPNTANTGFNASICIYVADIPGDGNVIQSGLSVPSGPAFADVKLTVKGVQFNRFQFAAISLSGGSGHVIQGNAFGAGEPGETSFRNGRAVLIGPEVSGVSVGGSTLAARNLIAGSTLNGVQVQGNGNFIVNNLVGPGRSGIAAGFLTENVRGIVLDGDVNAVVGNTISGNTSDAVLASFSAENNFIYGNLIGFTDDEACAGSPCSTALGNQRGVMLFGNTNRVQGNRIGNNALQGVSVPNGAAGNSIIDNSIKGNLGLGIDLANNGTAESNFTDLLEQANAANGGQNYPVLASASGPAKAAGMKAAGLVTGTLPSRNGTYRVQLFANAQCDGSGFGEGTEMIGEGDVVVTGQQPPLQDGSGSFAIPVESDADLIGREITATARASNGSTSEFGACVPFLQSNTPPVMADQVVVFPDDGPIGTQVPLVAMDDQLPSPPAALTFSMSPGQGPFTITPGGLLTQAEAGIFTNTDRYDVYVKVTDGEFEAQAKITVVKSGLFRDGFEEK